MHENFRYRNAFQTQKGSPATIFGTETKKFQRRIEISPSYAKNFWIPEVFLKHSRVLPRNFSELCDKKIRGKSVKPPHLLFISFFPYQKTSETQNGPSPKLFGPVRKKNFDKTMMPPSHALKFSIPEIF